MNESAAITSVRQRIKVIVSQDKMSVSLILSILKADEPAVTVEEVLAELQALSVVTGIDEAEIRRVIDENMVNSPTRIAVGVKPERGKDTQFTFHFDTSHKHQPKEDKDGHIDYHDINFIQNTSVGAVLVTRTPPGRGTPGRDVFGQTIEGPMGREFQFKAGQNTQVSEDGNTLLSTANGAIQFLHGKVSVADILIIKGDVDFSVGNLDCCGSLRVKGGIKSGFTVKVAGDLEVGGNVEDCVIECGGNVMIKGGFYGGGNGHLSAVGDVTVKFAEGQKITAGGDIIVGGEVISCQLQAQGNIRVLGRRGKIIGGDVKARKEIRAAVLGNEAGGRTLLTVGFDAAIMERFHHLKAEIERLEQDSGRVKDALYSLHRLSIDGKLPPGKVDAMAKLERFQKELPENLERLETEKAEIESSLGDLKDACIVAEEMIYPGVKASFGIVYREIVEEQARCRLTLEGNQVLISDFREK